MRRSAGCRVWDQQGREFLDYIMALGAVALGYGHSAVTEAAQRAVADGAVGSLPPVLEGEVAELLAVLMPRMERVRFLKTGAEAMASAVRIARAHTDRVQVLGCGYHGWLDWAQPVGTGGVPAGAAIAGHLIFDDVDGGRAAIRAIGDRLAAVVFEPIILREPSREWLTMLRDETSMAGALLIVDEVKTACRVAIGGATERYALEPDLIVIGKAIANGFALAAVGGRAGVMNSIGRTWISSTLATEFVGLAAARATLDTMVHERVPTHLARIGGRLYGGLRDLHVKHGAVVRAVQGIPEMCFLEMRDEPTSAALARGAAARGLLFKRSAYNFVSLAHDEAVVDRTLTILDEVLSDLGARPAAAPDR